MESIDDNFANAELKLNAAAVENLNQTARWANFLGIVGFIGLGLMTLGALSMFAMSSRIGRFPGFGVNPAVVGFIYLVIVVIQFFPVYYLYQFAGKMKQTLAQKDSITLEEATLFLRKHYQFIGILTIIIISLYVLAFIGGILGALA